MAALTADTLALDILTRAGGNLARLSERQASYLLSLSDRADRVTRSSHSVRVRGDYAPGQETRAHFSTTVAHGFIERPGGEFGVWTLNCNTLSFRRVERCQDCGVPIIGGGEWFENGPRMNRHQNYKNLTQCDECWIESEHDAWLDLKDYLDTLPSATR